VVPLPVYQAPPGLRLDATLNSVGSDTMNNLMSLWAESFKKLHPGVKLQVEGKGSATAPPALTAGVAQLGPMSRDMKSDEIDAFEKKHGYKPLRIRVALDALAIWVNKDNPIESLSLTQADAIFSKTRKRAHPRDVTTWGDLGLTGEWAAKPISAFGRNSASGTYGFFKEHVLSKGDFKDTVKEQPGSSSVAQGIAEDRFAIGYSGIGYRTPNVRAVALKTSGSSEAFEGTLENVLTGDYPLARYLNLYVNRAPGQPLDPTVKEFVAFILSRQGQEVVEKDGYFPLPADVVARELALVD
jgi:phosphate transport system substrate-binding protein